MVDKIEIKSGVTISRAFANDCAEHYIFFIHTDDLTKKDISKVMGTAVRV